jgi:hypothetical protein
MAGQCLDRANGAVTEIERAQWSDLAGLWLASAEEAKATRAPDARPRRHGCSAGALVRHAASAPGAVFACRPAARLCLKVRRTMR